MFSATKLVVAGSIVALFSGFLLVGLSRPALPPDTRPVPAAATGSPDTSPRGTNEFTGSLSIDGSVPGGPLGVIRYRYRVDEMTDPRLVGDYVLSYTQSFVDFGDGWEPLYNAAFRIENEDGSWEETPNLTLEYPDGSASSRTSALVGHGAYAGMTAIAEITYVPAGHFEIRGVITDDPVPGAPEHASTEQ